MPFQLLHYKPAFLYSLCVLFQRTILLASLYRVATWFFCAKVQAFHNVKRDRVLAMDANFNMAPGSRITEGTDRSSPLCPWIFFILTHQRPWNPRILSFVTESPSHSTVLCQWLLCLEYQPYAGPCSTSLMHSLTFNFHNCYHVDTLIIPASWMRFLRHQRGLWLKLHSFQVVEAVARSA